MKILLFLLLLISSVAHADLCDRVFVSGFSYHFDRSVHHNELNTGLGCVNEIDDQWRWTLGEYRNSNFRDSFFLSGTYMPWKLSEHWSAGTQFGIISGYNNSIMPIAIPEVRYSPTKNFDINLGFIPPVSTSSGLVGVYFTLGF